MVHDNMAKRNGFEPSDSKKVSVPVEFRRPPGEVDKMRRMMRELIEEVSSGGKAETFEESLDFRLDDDEDYVSPSETRYMTEERLLTEAEEASRVLMQRRAANEIKEKLYGKGKRGSDAGGKGGVEGGDGGVSEKRSAGAEQAGAKSGGESGVRGASEGGSGAVREAG